MNYQLNGDILTVTLTDGSCRKFRTQFPKKFNIHGFGSMNVIETLSPKLANNDYAYVIGHTFIQFKFTINNTKKCEYFTLQLEEIFDPIDPTIIQNDFKEHFMCLQNQINYLKTKVEELTEENRTLKEISYYSDN
jgi:hypothetical protein